MDRPRILRTLLALATACLAIPACTVYTAQNPGPEGPPPGAQPQATGAAPAATTTAGPTPSTAPVATAGPTATATPTASPAQPVATSTPAADARPPQNPMMTGLTLRQREYAEAQNTYFQRIIDDYTRRCGYQIDAKIDWRTFPEQIDRDLDGDLNVSFYSYCGEALEALNGMCRDNERTKAAIRERILSYTCVYTDGQRTISLEGTHLQMSIDWEAPNYQPYVRDYIGRTL